MVRWGGACSDRGAVSWHNADVVMPQRNVVMTYVGVATPRWAGFILTGGGAMMSRGGVALHYHFDR